MDNGPDFILSTLAEWADEYGVKLKFIKTGKPTQNLYIEWFYRSYRTEVREIADNCIQHTVKNGRMTHSAN